MKRVVEREWLDEMSPQDPRAQRARQDVRRINLVMGHQRMMAGLLARSFPSRPPALVADLGAGDGTFTLGVARRLAARWPKVKVLLIDRVGAISSATHAGFERVGWSAEKVQADVFDWLPNQRSDAIIANLFLHHFEADKLSELLQRVASATRVFAACEPRRGAPILLSSRCLWLLRCGPVTRHDAAASVRAGFCSGELSRLWPQRGWQARERKGGLFSHLFEARRVG